jgi:hypothetical protein
MPQPNPRKRPGHFERFEVLNLAPEDVVLEFYAAHDPADSRFPAVGPANHTIHPQGSFVQEPPELSPALPDYQPQIVNCEVVLNQSFMMEIVAPPGQYVERVTFEVRGFEDWSPVAVFDDR